MNRLLQLFFINLFLIFFAYAPGNAPEKQNLQYQLRIIEKKIAELEVKLRTNDKRLKTELESLDKIDRQLKLIDKKVDLYNREIKRKRNRVIYLRSRIDSTQDSSHKLQDIFKQQMIFAYKYAQGRQLDWMLGSENFNQAMRRYYYFRKVSHLEKSTLNKLRSLENKLTETESKLNAELNTINKYLTEAKISRQNIVEKKEQKNRIIQKITSNKKLLSQALNDKKKSYQRLSRLIKNLGKRGPSPALTPKTKIEWENLTGNFSKNKGKLNWPVNGKLLNRFGRHKNPRLKTVLNNTGIDIRSRRGTPVRCVFSGVVSLITYLSGFGNTVIIDHNDRYYTVYSHLDEILVNQGDFAESGSTIGTVGETGSLEGPKLHFEIYGNNKPLDPQKWLKKIRL